MVEFFKGIGVGIILPISSSILLILYLWWTLKPSHQIHPEGRVDGDQNNPQVGEGNPNNPEGGVGNHEG